MSRTSVPLLALVLATLVVGCEGQNLFTGSAAGVDVVGTYLLDTIDGEPLPFVLEETESSRFEIVRGVIELNRDETFLDRTSYERRANQQVFTEQLVYQGTYDFAGNTVTMSADDGTIYFLEVGGNSLTENVNGLIFVYRR